MGDINKNFATGVKKKPAPNPTNWKFTAVAPETKKLLKPKLPKTANIKNNFPAVYNQHYGNCTSNAALGCDDYYYHNSKAWVPSTTFTYYIQKAMTHDLEADDGSSIEAALDAVRKYGACNSKTWPNDEPWNKKPSKEAYENGLKGHEVTKYYNIENLTQLKTALSKGYPVAAAFVWPFRAVDKVTYLLNTPTAQEIKRCDCGHAVIIVGYDDNKKQVEIRNSWGTNWGNNGYCYMSYDVLKKCIWYDDTYAIIK